MPSGGREQRGSGGEQVSPPRFPETPPPPTPSGDYSYTLEIVMRMQETMGRLTQSVTDLKESVKELKADQKEHGEKLDGIAKKIYAAVAIIGVVAFFLQLFGPAIVSTLTPSPTPTPTAHQQPSPEATTPAPPSPKKSP